MAETPAPDLPAAPFERLTALVERLRAPGGCPWDREQSAATVRRFLLEEVYELLEALDGADLAAVREEMGDLLFQIVFLARLFEERGEFGLEQVAREAADKMVRRHPHVFGDAPPAASAEEVARRWADLKAGARTESPGPRSLLDGVARSLPALERAYELSERAASQGFDWADAASVLAKVEEEMAELREALGTQAAERVGEELGDLLFVLANLGRKLGANPEQALQRANAKFIRRFGFVEEELRARGSEPRGSSLDEMGRLWDEAKARGL